MSTTLTTWGEREKLEPTEARADPLSTEEWYELVMMLTAVDDPARCERCGHIACSICWRECQCCGCAEPCNMRGALACPDDGPDGERALSAASFGRRMGKEGFKSKPSDGRMGTGGRYYPGIMLADERIIDPTLLLD